MGDRAFRRAWWAIVGGVTTALVVLASCSDGSGDDDTSPTVESTEVATTEVATTDAPPESTDTTTGTTPETTTETTAAPATPVDFVPPTDNPDDLAAWRQVGVVDGRFVVADGVTPYTLNTPLFSDYAHKMRTVWIPGDAGPAEYDPEGPFDFPVGTVVTKTFYYPVADGDPVDGAVLETSAPRSVERSLDLEDVRLVETRVLVLREDGWHGLPYVWNEDETEATLRRTGDILSLTLVDDDGDEPFTYVVPDVNQCASCHATNHSTGEIELIGVQARHVNTDLEVDGGVVSQLDAWQELGLVTGVPAADQIPQAAVWDDGSLPLDDRARAYLDINCAHCHSPVGAADTSGLFLDQTTEIGPSYGICKTPVAAGGGTGGRLVDIYPGEPDESIMVYRMQTTEPDAMMPEIGRSTTHTQGVDLISEWIASLDGSC